MPYKIRDSFPGRAVAVTVLALLLSGCLAQSQIQGKYMDSQEDCRNQTANSVMGGETARPVSETQATPIAQRFSDCMTKEGWHLSTPKPGTAVAANTPPANMGSTFPYAVAPQAHPLASSYPANPNYPYTASQQRPITGATTTSTYYQRPVAAPVAAVAPVAATAAVAPRASVAPSAGVAPLARNAAAPVAGIAASAPVAATAGVANTAAVAPVASTAAAAPVSAAARTGATSTATGLPSPTTISPSPDVASYQPGRPSTEATPFYGTGPGRQF